MTTMSEIQAAMESRGITRKQLSEMANISQGSLSTYFSGKARPSEKTLQRIMRAVMSGGAPAGDLEFNPRYSPYLVRPASEVLGVSAESIRQRIRRGEVEWGRCMGGQHMLYLIDRKKFYEFFDVVLDIPARYQNDKS